MKGIADTGFLVAFARSRDMHHDWATRVAEEVTEPLLTCEAVLAETAFHLNNVGIVLEMVGDELVRLSFDCNDHLPQLADLAKRYADRKPDLADLCQIDPNDILGTANRKALAHLSATSSTFAPAGNVTGAGSNQRSSASLAFRTASSSVSPAEAHPGNSGKNAAQRLVCGSCSTTSRSFTGERITPRGFAGKPQMTGRYR